MSKLTKLKILQFEQTKEYLSFSVTDKRHLAFESKQLRLILNDSMWLYLIFLKVKVYIKYIFLNHLKKLLESFLLRKKGSFFRLLFEKIDQNVMFLRSLWTQRSFLPLLMTKCVVFLQRIFLEVVTRNGLIFFYAFVEGVIYTFAMNNINI